VIAKGIRGLRFRAIDANRGKSTPSNFSRHGFLKVNGAARQRRFPSAAPLTGTGFARMESPVHLTEDVAAGSLSEQLQSDAEAGFRNPSAPGQSRTPDVASRRTKEIA